MLLQKLHHLLLVLHCRLRTFFKKLLHLCVRRALCILFHLAVGHIIATHKVTEIL